MISYHMFLEHCSTTYNKTISLGNTYDVVRLRSMIHMFVFRSMRI